MEEGTYESDGLQMEAGTKRYQPDVDREDDYQEGFVRVSFNCVSQKQMPGERATPRGQRSTVRQRLVILHWQCDSRCRGHTVQMA